MVFLCKESSYPSFSDTAFYSSIMGSNESKSSSSYSSMSFLSSFLLNPFMIYVGNLSHCSSLLFYDGPKSSSRLIGGAFENS
jgi:hypothetical protein